MDHEGYPRRCASFDIIGCYRTFGRDSYLTLAFRFFGSGELLDFIHLYHARSVLSISAASWRYIPFTVHSLIILAFLYKPEHLESANPPSNCITSVAMTCIIKGHTPNVGPPLDFRWTWDATPQAIAKNDLISARLCYVRFCHKPCAPHGLRLTINVPPTSSVRVSLVASSE